MRLGVLTLFPEMFGSLTEWGVTGRAKAQGLYSLDLFNPRDHATDKHGTVDDRPYGGGPGMVMQAPIMADCLNQAKDAIGQDAVVIAMSPQGEVFDDAIARELAKLPALIFVAGRYEGIDERFLTRYVDREISLGDYVVSGGELPAMMVMDAVIRHLPGALGHSASAEEDSFAEGVLDCPHYTRPEEFEGEPVPPVLLSGNHAAIARWRAAMGLQRTIDRRSDLLADKTLTKEQAALLKEWGLPGWGDC